MRCQEVVADTQVIYYLVSLKVANGAHGRLVLVKQGIHRAGMPVPLPTSDVVAAQTQWRRGPERVNRTSTFEIRYSSLEIVPVRISPDVENGLPEEADGEERV